MKINICFGINDAYSKYCAVTIASILYNSNKKDKYKIYILTDFISKENRKKLNALKKIRNFELKIITFDMKFLERQKYLRVTLAAFYRYKIFDLIKEDKVIYLDSDIIVRKDIAQLFKTDFEGNLIAGVEDVYAKAMKNSIELDESATYVNSGMLFFNLKQCKKENIRQKLFDFLKTEKGKDWCDQNTLNYIFQNRIKLLDLKWNHMYTLNERNEYDNPEYYNALRFDPSINHYASCYKPWNTDFNCNLQYEYFKYAKLTLYYKEIINTYNILVNEELTTITDAARKNVKEYFRS